MRPCSARRSTVASSPKRPLGRMRQSSPRSAAARGSPGSRRCSSIRAIRSRRGICSATRGRGPTCRPRRSAARVVRSADRLRHRRTGRHRPMATARAATSANFLLTLEGVASGYMQSCVGGDVFADAIAEPVGGSFFVKKHIGQPKYDDITMQIGLGMAQPVNDWIAATWRGEYARKNGSIITGDATFKVQSEREFHNALITETTIPALDAAAKAAGHLTVKVSPEFTRLAKAGSAKLPPATQKQTKFVTSGFRLELDGLDCSRVRKIDSFTVQVHVSDDAVGSVRAPDKEPSNVEFPNLRVTLSDGPTAATWQTWLDDFVVNGNSGDGQEKGGTIVFLDPGTKELGRVVLHNVGMLALRHAPPATLIADLYCERMELQIGKSAPPAPVRKLVDPARIIGIRG